MAIGLTCLLGCLRREDDIEAVLLVAILIFNAVLAIDLMRFSLSLMGTYMTCYFCLALAELAYIIFTLVCADEITGEYRILIHFTVLALMVPQVYILSDLREHYKHILLRTLARDNKPFHHQFSR